MKSTQLKYNIMIDNAVRFFMGLNYKLAYKKSRFSSSEGVAMAHHSHNKPICGLPDIYTLSLQACTVLKLWM